MSRSVYGSYKGARAIYGISKQKETQCLCEPEVSPLIGLQALQSIIDHLTTAIQKFYDPAMGVAPIIADMTMNTFVSVPVFMRLRWIALNPDTKFDKTILAHREGLQFVYNLYNISWASDPLFMAIGI